jgi:hypothetical protein
MLSVQADRTAEHPLGAKQHQKNLPYIRDGFPVLPKSLARHCDKAQANDVRHPFFQQAVGQIPSHPSPSHDRLKCPTLLHVQKLNICSLYCSPLQYHNGRFGHAVLWERTPLRIWFTQLLPPPFSFIPLFLKPRNTLISMLTKAPVLKQPLNAIEWAPFYWLLKAVGEKLLWERRLKIWKKRPEHYSLFQHALCQLSYSFAFRSPTVKL